MVCKGSYGQAQSGRSDALMCDGKGFVCYKENFLGLNLGMGFIDWSPRNNKAPSCANLL